MTTAMASERPSQTRSIVSFFSGSLAATALSLLASLLITRWTPPHQLGVWNFALLISTYTSILQGGVFNGLNRQLPYYHGQGDRPASDRAASAAHGWCMALSGASVALTVCLGIVAALRGTADQLHTVLAIGTVISCSWFLQFLTVGYSGTSQFGQLARKNTAVAVLGLPLALLSQLLGYMGLLLRAATLAVLTVALLRYRRPLPSMPRWDPATLKELARIGFPIWVIGQLGALFMTLDRVVLADSPQALGYYAIAAQFGTLAAMVPTAFNAVHYTQMARDYGARHLARPLWTDARRAALRSAACGLGLAIPCWLLIPTFVHHVLPAYTPGIAAAQWASLTGVALAPSIFGNLFNLLGRQAIYLMSAAAGLAAFMALWFVLTKSLHLPPLVSAAQSMLAGTFVASITSALLALVVARRHDARQAALQPGVVGVPS